MNTNSGRFPLAVYLLAALGLVAQTLVLRLMGQSWICACGHVAFWYGNPTGPETSQHLLDWYTFTHAIHGFAFYFLLWLIAPRAPIALRLVLALGLEAAWEILENTPFIIERYRQSALARGYFGDSVVNSFVDTLAAMLGFILAHILPTWTSVAVVAAIEVFLAYNIRDNLTLNIIQLVHPRDFISRWQMGN
jgi:hypothetical protein